MMFGAGLREVTWSALIIAVRACFASWYICAGQMLVSRAEAAENPVATAGRNIYYITGHHDCFL